MGLTEGGMTVNEDRFTGMGKLYSRFRPAYPAAFLDDLYGSVGFTASGAIADIGSGTGILTEQLLGRGNTVYAVEPNDDMRREAENALRTFERFVSVKGTAEQTGLPDRCVDFVTAAQAFHWFDRRLFRLECGRILALGGKVALVWNSRDARSELVRETDALHRRYCPAFKGFSGGTRGLGEENMLGDFFDGAYETKTYENPLTYDEQGFIGRNLSASYAPKPADAAYPEYVAALRELFRKYGRQGALVMPNFTRCYSGRV